MKTKLRAKPAARSSAARKAWETRRLKLQGTPKKSLTRIKAPRGFVRIDKRDGEKTVVRAGCIKKWYPDESLSQIYSMGLEFAFVNEQGEQCHPFAFCKDFLHDAVWAQLNNSPVDVHQFQYNPGTNPALDLSCCRLAVRMKKQPGFAEHCANALRFLQEMEVEAGVPQSTLVYGGESAGSEVWVFTGDVCWVFSPVLLSFYSLALRVGLSYAGGGWRKHYAEGALLGPKDRWYCDKTVSALDRVLQSAKGGIFAKTLAENYPAGVGVYDLHGWSGVQAFAENAVRESVRQHWQKV